MKKLRALMAMAVACSMNSGYGVNRFSFDNKSVEEIIEDRRNRGVKSAYQPKPVKPWSGKRKLSKKKRKAN